MYGSYGCTTSSLPFAGMDAIERRIEFPRQIAERGRERRGAPDQHVIVAYVQASRVDLPDQFAQAASHPIAHDRVADLPRHGKPHTHRAFIRAAPRL